MRVEVEEIYLHREHRGTSELDFAPPARLVIQPFISSLSFVIFLNVAALIDIAVDLPRKSEKSTKGPGFYLGRNSLRGHRALH